MVGFFLLLSEIFLQPDITPPSFCKFLSSATVGLGMIVYELLSIRLARKWKEQGKILKSDYMNPEDREWLRMDLEDIIANNPNAIDSNPFEDDELWVKYFGEKP